MIPVPLRGESWTSAPRARNSIEGFRTRAEGKVGAAGRPVWASRSPESGGVTQGGPAGRRHARRRGRDGTVQVTEDALHDGTVTCTVWPASLGPAFLDLIDARHLMARHGSEADYAYCVRTRPLVASRLTPPCPAFPFLGAHMSVYPGGYAVLCPRCSTCGC